MEENNVYEKEYKIIKYYLGLQPGSSKIQVSSNTQISIQIINELIEQGKFEEVRGELRVARKNKKTMPVERKMNIINELASYIEDENEISKHQGQSKLVKDLEEKYGKTVEDDEWER